jgi:hypothetical protein
MSLSKRLAVVALLLLSLLSIHRCQAQELLEEELVEEDEYLREILEEERRLEEEYNMKRHHHHGDDATYSDDHHYTHMDPEEERLKAEAARKAEEERIAHEQAERIRLQREAEFEAELARMNDEQAKAAKRQKRKDARIVRRVLRSAQNDRHYAVLGVRNLDWKIGPLTLFRAPTKAIRRAYRKQSLAVHPDKNRDGRANEAFIAVENAASILSDESLRDEYDVEVRLARRQRRQDVFQFVADGTELIRQIIGRIVWLFRRILGPFATPIFILGCLLI